MNQDAVGGADPVDAAGACCTGHDAAPAELSSADGLIRLSRLIQEVFAEVSGRHELTPVQARLLGVLSFGSRGMAELARMFGVERGALTGLVDRAERRGLVHREAVPGDRRAVHVVLTEAGRATGAAVHAESTAELDRLLEPLTGAEREALRAAMTKILTAREQQRGR